MTNGSERSRGNRPAGRHGKWVFADQPGITMRIVKQGNDLWRACESLEYEVFTDPDIGYYDPNDEGRIPDFDVFGRQEFVTALVDGVVVGVLRLMYSDETTMREGLFQTYDHRGEIGINRERERYLQALAPRRMVDLSSIAVTPAVRNSLASQAIITRTIQRIWETGRRYSLACIDTPFLGKLKARGLDFQDLGPSIHYWGSLSTAAILDTYSVPTGRDRLSISLHRAKGFLELAGLVHSG